MVSSAWRHILWAMQCPITKELQRVRSGTWLRGGCRAAGRRLMTLSHTGLALQPNWTRANNMPEHTVVTVLIGP